jgi:chromosome partitioning protein
MQTILITNQKGGVGKTTTSFTLAAALAQEGKRVLLIDLDGQAHLTKLLDVEPKIDALDVLVGDNTLAKALIKTPYGDLLGASERLYAPDKVLYGTGAEHRLRKALIGSEKIYDYVIIDPSATIGILTVNALTAADWIVVPVRPGSLDLDSMRDLEDAIKAVQEFTNPDLKIAGFLLTQTNPQTNLSQNIYSALEADAEAIGTKAFKTIIRNAVGIPESQTLHQDIFTYAKSERNAKKVAGDYRAFVSELIGDIQ